MMQNKHSPRPNGDFWTKERDLALNRFKDRLDRYAIHIDHPIVTENFDHDKLQNMTAQKGYTYICDKMDQLESWMKEHEVDAGSDQLFDEHEYQEIITHYLCAGCWGSLAARFAPGRMWEVYCPSCGSNRGFHSKYTVRRRRNEDAAIAAEARMEMSKSVDWVGVNDQSAEESLKELGF